jgi:formylmethanofuran dehydrogenase subunit A
MSCIVIEYCTLWDGTSPEVREAMHVLVEGKRIREISERSLTAPQAQVNDCRGKTLMPGLIDAHVHLIAMSLNLSQLAQEPVSLTRHMRVISLKGCCGGVKAAAFMNVSYTPIRPYSLWSGVRRDSDVVFLQLLPKVFAINACPASSL